MGPNPNKVAPKGNVKRYIDQLNQVSREVDEIQKPKSKPAPVTPPKKGGK